MRCRGTRLRRQRIFTLRLVGFGTIVFVSEPDGIREVFAAGSDDAQIPTAAAFGERSS